MSADPQPSLECTIDDLRRRIRTQTLLVDQLKTKVFEFKQRARRSIDEEDMVGARGWLIQSKQSLHQQELEWNRLLLNTQLLTRLERATSDQEQARHLARVNNNMNEVLLQMPPDVVDLIDRAHESMARIDDNSEQLAYVPRNDEIDEELHDLQNVHQMTSFPLLRSTIHAERERLSLKE
jgi:hypothetical protein